jgi:hypothetical protein
MCLFLSLTTTFHDCFLFMFTSNRMFRSYPSMEEPSGNYTFPNWLTKLS